ncbi:MAG: hypothetical protein DU480_04205 [Nitrosomonas sp.]|uniref:hypothetical protein n=1 Tax=Nitrosomonas sp. TaxID=42353 RepID=UPI0032EED2A4
MHPNAFLRTLWRAETVDQVFVAMSFDSRFSSRYEEVIRPAIEDQMIAGYKLIAHRVDNSKTGDSILTEIINGISHARLVLADVSIVDEGRYTQEPVRNGNVMYEVGVALACRTPSEVLLIRDDSKKFLFDVSTIPHIQIDFSAPDAAILALRIAIEDRIKETSYVQDARIQMLASSLTTDELRVLQLLSSLEQDYGWDFSIPEVGLLSYPDARGISGLLQKGCAKSMAINPETRAVLYALTPFGFALARVVEKLLRKVVIEAKEGGDGKPDNPVI